MRRLSVLALLAALAACDSGGPFVYIDPTVTLNKPSDLIRRNGYFQVCYGDGEDAKADALAAETCADYKLVPRRAINLRYQCALTEPHEAFYYCIDPTMRMADGSYINPLNRGQLKKWREQQERLKAYAAAHGGAAATPAAPTPEPTPEPAATPPAPEPLPAAAPPVAIPPVAIPQSAAPPATSEFDPQVGGWGRAWDAAGNR